MGVIATQPIAEDDWQIIYGQVVHEANQYCFEGNFHPYAPWMYLNHSNVPNCEVCMDDDGVHYISALTDIAVGEELTIDYGEQP